MSVDISIVLIVTQIYYKVDCGTVAVICFSISIKGVNFIRGRLIKNNSKLVCVQGN